MITGRRRPCLVLFQSFTTVSGQYELTKTWAEESRAWVNLEPDRGKERYVANEREAYVSHTIRGDYHDLIGITPHMRMIFDPTMSYDSVPSTALVYNILAVMPAHNDLSDVVIKVEQEGRDYGEITS